MIDYKRIKIAPHDYVVKYTTDVVGHTYRLDLEDVPLLSLEQLAAYIIDNAMELQDKGTPQMVLSIKVDGWPMNKNYIAKLNLILSANKKDVDECDGGIAAGGDAGGMGDASGSASNANASDVAGEMAGTSITDVIGKFEPGKGVMGPGNFMMPVKVKHPLHRWEIANGGSRRKKGKNGKPKKYDYEKGMKVVVNMFEDEASADKMDEKKLNSKLHRIAKGIKTIDDVKAVEAKVRKDKSKIESKLSKSSGSQSINFFKDFYGFIRDICNGSYTASWFTITMVAVGLVYVLSPIDIIPDIVPVAGLFDDAYVLKLIYDAVKDEMLAWKASKR